MVFRPFSPFARDPRRLIWVPLSVAAFVCAQINLSVCWQIPVWLSPHHQRIDAICPIFVRPIDVVVHIQVCLIDLKMQKQNQIENSPRHYLNFILVFWSISVLWTCSTWVKYSKIWSESHSYMIHMLVNDSVISQDQGNLWIQQKFGEFFLWISWLSW